MLILRPITRDNWRAALALTVRPEQQRFIADVSPPVAIMLAKAYIQPGGRAVTPLAIYAGEVMVGGVNLLQPRDGADDCWLQHFFIDARQQGRGYGGAALAAILARVAELEPGCRALSLTVHPENTQAQRLYVRAGFRPTGAQQDGEPVYRLLLAERTP